MNEQQITAVRCAMADLLHVYGTRNSYDIDWKSVRETILDLAEAFPFLDEDKDFVNRVETLDE